MKANKYCIIINDYKIFPISYDIIQAVDLLVGQKFSTLAHYSFFYMGTIRCIHLHWQNVIHLIL